MRTLITVAVASLLSVALAVTLPAEATMFVTDDDGVIVGVGHSQAGERFVLDVIASYQGFARLVIVTSAGEVVVHEVVVMRGTVLLELVDLRSIARRSGFAEVVVEAIDVVDTARAFLPAALPGAALEAAPGMGPAGSVDAPSRPADAGAPRDAPVDAPSSTPAPLTPVPAPPPPVGPPGPPTGSPDTPVALPDEPGPPLSTPGLPDGPPAHGPGGAHGGGNDAPDAPAPDGEDDEEP